MKKKFLIVLANYYPGISNELFNSAYKYLKKKNKINIKKKRFKVIEVPGVFEIPVVISRQIKKFDAIVALGCVIKGETPHFNFISKASTDALMKLSIEYKKPIGNGIITCLNKKQAITRSKKKGQEAAKAVVTVLENS
tara:strand:+ start:79 stop:492 length:414 start_codon:yes stop_codon:yes gene_type:complete